MRTSETAGVDRGPGWSGRSLISVLTVTVALTLSCLPGAWRLALVMELVVAGVCVGTSVLCLRAATASRARHAVGWALLGAALCSWAVAMCLVFLRQVLSGFTPDGAAHAFEFAAMLLAVIGVWVMPRGRWLPGAAARTLLDVVAMLLCVLLFGSVVVVRYVSANVELPADRLFTVLYPSATVALTGSAYLLSRRHGGHARSDLNLLVLGFGLWSLAATSYVATRPGSWVLPPYVSFLFASGAVLLGLAAGRSRYGVDDPPVATRSNRVLTTLPEVVVVSAAVAAVVGGLKTTYDVVIAVVAAGVVVTRQSVIAVDARRSRDSLERKVLERTEALRQLAGNHERILGAAADGIVGIDGAGQITFANAAAGRLLDCDATDLVGRVACDVMCVDGHHDCLLAISSRLPTELLQTETTYRTSSGRVLPVERTTALMDVPAPGTGAGLVVAFRDITERQRVEQMKRRFISSVSHELRTPLTSIRGTLEMLADGDAGELPDSAQRLVSAAQRGGERLSRLVNDIIDIEQLSSDGFSVDPRTTVMADLVGGAVRSMDSFAMSSGVLLRVTEASGAACCDPDRVEQAVVNLVGNAVKFSPPGATVSIGVRERDGEITVSVADEGRGIPSDEVNRIFDRFHQVVATDATEKGGAGLGLTITRSIVERHGGRIWVDSTEGRGSTFFFTLPPATFVSPAGDPATAVA